MHPTSTMAKVAVLGAGGYLGGELLRLLGGHPEFDLAAAVSATHAGRPLAEIYPNLPVGDGVVARPDAAGIDADVAFLAQGPGEAMKTVPELLERGIKVVDLGPDYRLPTAAQYEAAYGRPHTDPDHLGEAVYGLPEFFADRIRAARLVANPGCYPTATLLALLPLLRAGALQGRIVVDAKSGSSGAGQGFSAATHHPEAALTVLPYGLPAHRHVPEMLHILGAFGDPVPPLQFVPHLVPVVRGILCSIYPTPAAGVDPAGWPELWRSAYAASPFVRIGGLPRLPWAQGTNRCYLSFQPAAGGPVLFSALDNLGKGGAAQAIQNANLMTGVPAARGLDLAGFGV